MKELTSYQKLFLFIASFGLSVGCLMFGANTEYIIDYLGLGFDEDTVFSLFDNHPDSNAVPFNANVGRPSIRCEGKEIIISFQFDRPVSGDFRLQWFDSSDNHAKILNESVEESTTINFRYTNPPKDYEELSITDIYLVFEDGSQYGSSIYEEHQDEGEVHWDACASSESETSKTENESEESPYVPPVVEPQATEPPPSEPLNPDGIPIIYNATCLKGSTLMVVFEFPEPVTGLYTAQVDGTDYQYTPVPKELKRAYFIGPPPKNQGPASVSLSTITDGAVVFEQQDYEFPACGVQTEKKDDGGDGGYVPPAY